jgi:hypothetical protein
VFSVGDIEPYDPLESEHRAKDRDKSKEKEKEKERAREREREREKDQKGREKERDKIRDKERDKDRDRGKGGDKGRGKAAEEDEDEEEPAGPPLVYGEKKGGRLDKRIVESEQAWYQKQLEDVRQWLLDRAAWTLLDVQCTLERVAKLAALVHHGMHVQLGRHAPEERRARMTRLPHRLFADMSAGGGLCLILSHTLRSVRCGSLLAFTRQL